MRIDARLVSVGAIAFLLVTASYPVTPLEAQARVSPQGQVTFRVNVDLVTTDVIVRDRRDRFVADLKATEFEVYEDGVKQDIASVLLTHGGKVHDIQIPSAPAREGIIVPANRPTNDAAGRIFVIVLDDLHLDLNSTPRVRDLIRRMLRTLIHEGDMFGIVSTGTSSISQQLTYDRQILESAISRMTGGGLRPKEIIEGQTGPQGPTELRHRAHVAFSVAYDLMRSLEKVHNRRKAVLYISSGYDFNPFEASRLEEQARRAHVATSELQTDPFSRTQQSSQLLSESDLVRELAELTRAANRANATIYTIDPRGLAAGPDIDQDIKVADWNAYLRDSQGSLRVIAEGTGGVAVVNQNDFDKALKRIDAETSDYYVLAYYSTNPDPLKRTRRIEVKITRAGLNVWSRTSYSRPPPNPDAR